MSHPGYINQLHCTDTYWTKFGEREFITCIKQEQVPSSAFADTQVIYEIVRGECVRGKCVRGECVEVGVCGGGSVWRWDELGPVYILIRRYKYHDFRTR